MAQQTNVVKSVVKAFDIIEYLKEVDRVTVTELSAELGMPKSTVQMYLNTLLNHDFVVKRRDQYELGLRFLDYGMESLRWNVLYPTVKPKVEELARDTGELVGCFVEENGKGIYMYAVEGDQAIKTNLAMGNRVNLHSCAGGKAILAYLPRERVREIITERGLDPNTEHTITDADVLFEELDEIREQGYAHSQQESLNGVRAVAAPVLYNEMVVGSISIAGPATRFVDERFETDLPRTVMQAANEIELQLLYSDTESGL